ncbi:MAG: hypothetical protein IJI45_06685 [Anaerolineaceae bacterium]|nr:hypothetical protein [Anaerolineaceae bacterium]
MANYNGVGRTNYFRVADEERYAWLYGGLSSEDVIDITETDSEGNIRHGFAIYGSLDWVDPDEEEPECNLDYFLDEIQKIMPEDEAFIYVESGHEKIRYITGFAFVITKNQIDCFDLNKLAVDKAIENTGNSHVTVPEY